MSNSKKPGASKYLFFAAGSYAASMAIRVELVWDCLNTVSRLGGGTPVVINTLFYVL
jgi:hypothetical protein